MFPKSRTEKAVGIASLVGCSILLLLPVVFKLDGKVHGDWQQFLGRFHPLMVHLPIGLILLVPVLELAGLIRPAMREAAALVLWLSVPACLASAALGYLLAYGSGDTGARVTHHMWGGIALTIGVYICALVRTAWTSRRLNIPQGVYPGLLAAVVLLLTWAAHQGGSLTHGDKYLTEYLPAPLKHLPRFLPAGRGESATADSFYSKQVNPILDANCAVCHGPSKVQGHLRLDSYDLLMRGGADGAVVVPGSPERSTLFQRITLPTDHKKFMPSEGKPPLNPQDILIIKTWIAEGASPTVTSLKGLTVREPERSPKPVGEYSALIPEVERAAYTAGVTVVAVSRNPADGLILSAVDAPERFGDAQLASFQKFAPFIVELELGRSAVTDGCFDTLARFKNLRALHLENTRVTGAGLLKLASLTELSYLNLSGTRVTTAALAPLSSMTQLRHLYLYDTPAQPVVAAPGAPPSPDPSKEGKTP